MLEAYRLLYQNTLTAYGELIDGEEGCSEAQHLNKVICEEIQRRDLPSTCMLDLDSAFRRVGGRVVINAGYIQALVIGCPAVPKALLFHPDWNVRRIAMREYFYRARADIFEVFDEKEFEELTLWSCILRLDEQWFDCVLSSIPDRELRKEVWRALIHVRLVSDAGDIEGLASLRLEQSLAIGVLDEVLSRESQSRVLQSGHEIRRSIESGEVPD
ncbi:MAG: hypothetical protein SF028_05085 [Candidatus Sumerlaeia bacterium]|nr:hypothetical protein [Candidatus Sumerlaeia bacterium]